jgi:NTE family protein
MRWLCLSGGGAKGAFQAGAVYHLLAERKVVYDGVCGTSVGAINAAWVAQHRRQDAAQAAEALRSMWYDLPGSHGVYKKWYGGWLGRLPAMWKLSVYHTKPLRKLLTERLDLEAIRLSGIELRVGAVSLNTGNRRVWDQTSPHLIEAVMASSSFPGMFPPEEIHGQLYTDDGVREITPIEEAIRCGARCVHVVQNSPSDVVGQFDGEGNVLDVAKRVVDAMSVEVDKWDLKVVELYNALHEVSHPLAKNKKRVDMSVLRPSQPVLEDALDFDPAKVRTNFDRGLQAARDMDWKD